ncbi:hypothetical protein J1D01_11680 [Seonamhaeicola sp. NFXS20]|uniref:hypothetical protein n=1 Tax=Seonamhaeicola sp. NFXS20 TaxID=2816959 RepID=UPI003B8C2822
MSITHNLETLTDKQKSDLELAQTLLDNLNSLKPAPNYRNNSLSYDGEKFKTIRFGFFHKFLVQDIHLAIQGDYQKHKDFILDAFQREVDDYLNRNKTEMDLEQLKDNASRLLKYYGFNSYFDYPLYSDESNFKKVLDNINNSINSLIK